jgi:hypothetical protein
VADVVQARSVSDPGGDLLRTRLHRVAERLQYAVNACRAAGFSRLASVLSVHADEVGRLLEESSLPSTRIVENAVGRGEHAVAVWQDLAAF